MADLSNVRTALAQIIGNTLYPGGVPGGTNPASPTTACPVRCYAGWPEREALDADLAAGIVNVSIFARPDGRNTTRYPVVDMQIAVNAATLSWNIAGNIATLSGAPAAGQNVGLLVDGNAAYLYAVQAVDTLATIAASLATLIPGAVAGAASVTVPGATALIGRVGATGTTLREVGRQLVTMQISIWAPSDALRAAVAAAILPVLQDQRRITLADTSIAMIRAQRDFDVDTAEKPDLYRRDAWFDVEYATTITGTTATVEAFIQTLTPVAALGGPMVGTETITLS